MSIYVAQVTLGSNTGIPRDSMTNTTHWQSSSPNFANLEDMLFDFYTANSGPYLAIKNCMTGTALDGSWTLKVYDLDDPKPRAPVYESELSMGSLGTDAALPTEVALVTSYHCSYMSGEPAGRRRNRFYLGGLKAAFNVGGRPSAPLMDSVMWQTQAMAEAARASISWNWKVYSPVSVGNGADPELATWTTIGGWVDNAWDTQRRRGVSSTSRVMWNI